MWFVHKLCVIIWSKCKHIKTGPECRRFVDSARFACFRKHNLSVLYRTKAAVGWRQIRSCWHQMISTFLNIVQIVVGARVFRSSGFCRTQTNPFFGHSTIRRRDTTRSKAIECSFVVLLAQLLSGEKNSQRIRLGLTLGWRRQSRRLICVWFIYLETPRQDVCRTTDLHFNVAQRF